MQKVSVLREIELNAPTKFKNGNKQICLTLILKSQSEIYILTI
jgi:hypothetical protein